MPIGRRGPGLVGAAARTAVVAGTATAVSGNVSRRQQQKYAQQGAAQQPAEPAAGQTTPQGDTTAQLTQLAQLKDQGIITEQEFAAKKKQLLGI